ncbi:MTAP family purine nucleoside phosphorylase [Fodinibius saliphilus]|uniref:phosphorylase family protein n=1 Tax=Fodinibius saliphilus TaxID=1920650 RepID=UPI001109F828|nr:MTAP family purine nucleoside phosphorylase [Fodinibius saliphilus]
MQSLAIILGSAFKNSIPQKLGLQPIEVDTKWGKQIIYGGSTDNRRKIFALNRHGSPHHLLPHQINYRAQAAALKAVNCGALVINSSVGVLTEELPLYKPLLLTDQLMPENRLPDGSTCSMFQEPTEEQGHLVLNEGLFSNALSKQLYERHSNTIHQSDEVVFVYAGGPRSKTPAENKMWGQLGGDVNSMTLAPEVILANELEIPVAGLVVGHKYSIPSIENPPEEDIRESLVKARAATKDILIDFLQHGETVSFGNHIYKY